MSSKSETVVVVTEVAVIVGVLFGAAGSVSGGVYITLNGCAELSVPHAGLHAAPCAVSVQVTPALVVSNSTCASSVTGGAPGAMFVILFVMCTTTCGAPIANVSVIVTEALALEVAVRIRLFGVGGRRGAA